MNGNSGSPDYDCEVANPACRKRRVLGTRQWQSTLVVGLLVTQDWFKMGCHLSPSLISTRLTAWTDIGGYPRLVFYDTLG